MKRRSALAKSVAGVALAVLMLVAALAPQPAMAKKKPKAPEIDIAKLVWPFGAPVPRVRFIGAYYGEEIKGVKKQGFLEKLAGVEDRASRNYLKKPYGIAIDSKGRAFVADSIAGVVFVFDVGNKTLEYRGDKPPAAFQKPIGVAIDAKDRLFVSDSALHNITVFDADGNVLTVFGEEELVRPGGMAIDEPMERLYVTDIKARRVAQFNLATFKFEGWIGKAPDEVKTDGDRAGMLVGPTDVAVHPDGQIYVVDTLLDHVKVFDPDGTPVRTIGDVGAGAGRFMRPRGIAFDTDGHFYVCDGMNNLFQILEENGQPLMPVGRTGMLPGQFQVPAGIAIDKNNRIFVADQLNGRIQVFRYVTEEEAAQERARLGIKKHDPQPAGSAGKAGKQ